MKINSKYNTKCLMLMFDINKVLEHYLLGLSLAIVLSSLISFHFNKIKNVLNMVYTFKLERAIHHVLNLIYLCLLETAF